MYFISVPSVGICFFLNLAMMLIETGEEIESCHFYN